MVGVACVGLLLGGTYLFATYLESNSRRRVAAEADRAARDAAARAKDAVGMQAESVSLMAHNAVVNPPLVAALRLPFTLALGFVAALVLDPIILLLASKIDPHSFKVDGFGWALLASLVIGVVSLVLQ